MCLALKIFREWGWTSDCTICSHGCRRPRCICTARANVPAERSDTSTSSAHPADRRTTRRMSRMCANARCGPHTGCRMPNGQTDGMNIMADERLREVGAAGETPTPRVGVIMGSDSDWSVMEDAAQALAEFDVPFEVGVVS